MADTTFDAAESDMEQPDEPANERQTGNGEIDIEALAEKVYRLMLAEIRLDRARGLAAPDGR